VSGWIIQTDQRPSPVGTQYVSKGVGRDRFSATRSEPEASQAATSADPA
jgi:hypothetical protein